MKMDSAGRRTRPADGGRATRPYLIREGLRDEMIEILKENAVNMPGCFSYVVAKDAADENTIWVTEVWDSMASHEASLSLPAVNAIPRGTAIVSNFEGIAVTNPVWRAGLAVAHTR